jgi:hypothetical protein
MVYGNSVVGNYTAHSCLITVDHTTITCKVCGGLTSIIRQSSLGNCPLRSGCPFRRLQGSGLACACG